ncbi:MAG: hypothetical protein AABX30_02725 [Nanoarchaeota archaeon]
MIWKSLEKRLKQGALVTGLLVGLSSSVSDADTIYYGKLKGAQRIAYVEFDEVKVESKYHKQLERLSETDPKYTVFVNKRYNSIVAAITEVAKEEKYDVVIEKGDPDVKNSTDIGELVMAKLEEIEKDA